MASRTTGPTAGGEAGFTLVEALMAMVILSFGLMAVTNLFLVAGSSNQVASHSTAASAAASEVMERLKAIPFSALMAATGGTLGSPTTPTCIDDPYAATPVNCVAPGTFAMRRLSSPVPVTVGGAAVEGVGWINTWWTISNPLAGGADTLYIVVRSESDTPIAGGVRSRAEFTTFRTCTVSTC